MRGVLAVGAEPSATIKNALAASPSMNGLDLASAATIPIAYTEGPTDAKHHVVAFDFGMKRNILRLFVQQGCRVTVVPAATNAAQVWALKPSGVFLSNGAGDPAAVGYAVQTIREASEAQGAFSVF